MENEKILIFKTITEKQILSDEEYEILMSNTESYIDELLTSEDKDKLLQTSDFEFTQNLIKKLQGKIDRERLFSFLIHNYFLKSLNDYIDFLKHQQVKKLIKKEFKDYIDKDIKILLEEISEKDFMEAIDKVVSSLIDNDLGEED